MLPLYKKYWGKADLKMIQMEGAACYHLLPYHCLDVAAVGKELVLKYKPCEYLIKKANIKIEQFADIFSFFLCLHDFGKFSVTFQTQRTNLSSELIYSNENFQKPYSIRHDRLGFILWEWELSD